jgi:hypothetical protein
MYIEPPLTGFDYVTIRRTGGILGVNQLLHVDGELRARVEDRHAGTRAFELDAFTSQELLHALATLAERQPAPSPRTGCDLFHYDIELAVDGRVYRFNTVDIGADEALHGVMLAANRLIEHDPLPFHVMSLHTLPATDPTPAA